MKNRSQINILGYKTPTTLRYILFVFTLFLVVHLNVKAQQSRYVRTVVIDAGHGGKDPGTRGKKTREKDIALAIALKAGKYIEDNFNDVKVIYTRKKDVFIPLNKRASIANKNNADFFISIHCNAAGSKKTHGTETFVMGLHRSKANLEVAKKENAAILLEENYRDNYDGFDPNSDEGYISLSLLQNVHLEQSILMADLLQKQFTHRVGRKNRSVKQAGFLVLYKITMPGVLIETGFLSNTSEENFLRSKKGQDYMASAIFRAFRSYKQETEKNLPPPLPSNHEITDDEIANNGIFLTVQFFSSEKPTKINADNFGDEFDKVNTYKHKGRHKYTIGKYTSLSKANRMKLKMQQLGFNDAFIIGFKGKKRINVKEAIKKLSY